MNEVKQNKGQNTIDQLSGPVYDLCQRLLHEDISKPYEICQIIRESGIRADMLKAWTDLNHPSEDSYGRKMVFEGPNFEVMVMSWAPGDFSAIHDHGYTQWGAVQVFGEAEHATFRVEDEEIQTLTRNTLKPGKVVGVGHSLIHQMGNPSDKEGFISLHVYGDTENRPNITADARLYDLEENVIQKINGGVFFALPEDEIDSKTPGPSGDFPTKLRHHIELFRRLQKINSEESDRAVNLDKLIDEIFSADQYPLLMAYLENIFDEDLHVTDSNRWSVIRNELKEAAKLQEDLYSISREEDAFRGYARLYDDLVGKPSLNHFMQHYLTFFKNNFAPDMEGKEIISLGCGTGLVESYMVQGFDIKKEQIYGIDVSPGMIEVASERINAEIGDIMTLDPEIKMWDIAYSGLNVFQYIKAENLKDAIQKTSNIVRPGGFFLGDFITPDHIRWYPNFMQGENGKTLSLREPKLVEDGGKMYQESEIINIEFRSDRMHINYAGKHRRYLPPMHRIRNYFIEAFGPEVYLFDAINLQPIQEEDDSCPSTRYIVVAIKS